MRAPTPPSPGHAPSSEASSGTTSPRSSAALGALAALALALALLAACATDPDPSSDGADASDTSDAPDTAPDADTGPAPTFGPLSGPWPQATIGRPGLNTHPLAAAYTVARDVRLDASTPWAPLDCSSSCQDLCGLSLSLPEDRRLADWHAVVSADDRVIVHLLEGPAAAQQNAGAGFRSRLVSASATTTSLSAGPELTPDLDALADLATLPGATAGLPSAAPSAIIIRDLFLVERDPAHVPADSDSTLELVALAHLFFPSGQQVSVRDAVIGLDPQDGSPRWLLALPPEVFAQSEPFLPNYGAFMGRVTADGGILVLRAGRIDPIGRLYTAPLPASNTVATLAPLDLETAGFPYSVTSFDVDHAGRIHTLGLETPSYPLCAPGSLPLPRLRLRSFSSDGDLLLDLADPANTYAEATSIRAARDLGTDPPALQLLALGHAPTHADCLDAQHYPKSPSTFTDAEDDLSACPRRFEALCTSTPNACPCRGCEGLLQICPPPLDGRPGPAVATVFSFSESLDDPDILEFESKRAQPIPSIGPVAFTGRGRVLIAGTHLSVLDTVTATAPTPLSAPGWDTVHGLLGGGDATLASLHGGWQSPLVSHSGDRFVAALRQTRVELGAFSRDGAEYAGPVTGRLASPDSLESRTLTRVQGPRPDNLAARAELDRVYPLGSGALLHVFGWAGPPVRAGLVANERTLELRLATPSTTDYWRARDISPPAASALSTVTRCPLDPTTPNPPPCGLSLGLETDLAELDPRAPAREVSCTLGPNAAPTASCNIDTLRDTWNRSQSDTLARASSGRLAVECTPAGTATRTTSSGNTHTLHLSCSRFAEHLRPTERTTLVSLHPPPTTPCAELGQPLPLRAVLTDEPFELRLETPDGDPLTEAAIGDPVALFIDLAPGTEATTVRVELVSGAATFPGDATSVTLRPGESTLLNPTAEGALVIRVTVFDASGQPIGTRLIAVAIEGPNACSGAPDGSTFRPCNPPLAAKLPLAERDQESAASPAQHGLGVLLHDRSLRLTDTDLADSPHESPLAIARTHRSSRIPDEGGLMGGWTFAFDQRLSPVTDRERQGLADPTWLLDESDGSTSPARHFDLAVSDGSGFVAIHRHPGADALVTFDAASPYPVWDPATQRAIAPTFTARVVTYERPRGVFATLRGYTLIVPDGSSAAEVHPFYRRDRPFRPTERRFYELAEPDGHRRIFDCKGRLVFLIDPQLRETELVYAGPVHPLTQTRALTALIDPAHRTWSLTWENVGAAPRIAAITDPHGRQIRYRYLATPRGAVLDTVERDLRHDTDPALSVLLRTRYTYDTAGRLTAVRRDRTGRLGSGGSPPPATDTLTLTYDAEGRVLRQVLGRDPDAAGTPPALPAHAHLSAGEVLTFASPSPTTVTATDGRGHTRTFELAPLPDDGPLVLVATSYPKTIWDESASPSGPSGPTASPVTATATTRSTHHPSGLIATTTTPLGRVHTFTWTPLGHPLSHREDPAPGATPGAAPSREATWTWVNPNRFLPPHLACERVASATTVTGALTTTSYASFSLDSPGTNCQPTHEDLPDTPSLDGLSDTWRLVHHRVPDGPLRGLPTARELLLRFAPVETTRWLYLDPPAPPPPDTPHGKLPFPERLHPTALVVELPRAALCPDETATETRTDLVWDQRDNLVQTSLTRNGPSCSSESPCPAGDCVAGLCRTRLVIAKTYDGADRVVETVTNPGPDEHITRATYDEQDRPIEVRELWRDDTPSSPAMPPDLADRSTRWVVHTYRYDPAGRLDAMSTRSPDDPAATFELSGHDAAGGLRLTLTPGSGATDAEVAAVLARIDAHEPIASLLADLDPATRGEANYRSATPSGAPFAVDLDPRFVARHLELDEDGLPLSETLTGHLTAPSSCASCATAQAITQRWFRDLEGRVRVYRPGRTDRPAGDVAVEASWDGLGRMSARTTYDPGGCAGPATVLRRELYSDYRPDDRVGQVEIRGYDGEATLTGETLDAGACSTDALLSRSQLSWDTLGRPLEERLERFAAATSTPPVSGLRVIRTAFDLAGRPVGRRVQSGTSTAATDRVERMAYGPQGTLCARTVEGPDGQLAFSQRAVIDEAGLATTERLVHHPDLGSGDPTHTIETHTAYDAFGRPVRVTDGLGIIRSELAWDSLDRPRAELGADMMTIESLYDALGDLVATRRHLPDGEIREVALTHQGRYATRETDRLLRPDGSSETLADRRHRYDVAGRLAVTFPLGPDGPHATRYHTATGQVWLESSTAGWRLAHELDALGNVTTTTATAPSGPPPGYAAPARHDLRAGTHVYRFDGLSRPTLARTLSLSGAPLTTVLRTYDSHGNILIEDHRLHVATGKTARSVTRASWDERSRLTRLDPDTSTASAPGTASTIYTWDRLDRLVRIAAAPERVGQPGPWKNAHPEQIDFHWSGQLLSRRVVTTGSTFNPAAARTFTTTLDHDELGQRHLVEHAEGANRFSYHRRWFWAGNEVVSLSSAAPSATPLGLPPALANASLRGKSHLRGPPPSELFAAPDDTSAQAGAPFGASLTSRELIAGESFRSVTRRWSPGTGQLGLSGVWSERDGERLVAETSLSWDPQNQRALEARHLAFTYGALDRVAATHHLYARKFAAPFSLPSPGGTANAPTLGGAEISRQDHLAFTYGGDNQLAHDGCLVSAGATTCPSDQSARHRFRYDAFDRLVAVDADEPDACRSPGPGKDEVFPVSDGLRVVYDGFGRRVFERFLLPEGCPGLSRLPAERSRHYAHLGDLPVTERVFDTGGDDGIHTLIHGPDGLAWVSATFPFDREAFFVVFSDTSDQVVGVYSSLEGLIRPDSPAPWVRAWPMLALDPAVGIAFRHLTARGAEGLPFGKLTYTPGSGFAFDLRTSHAHDRYLTTFATEAGFWETTAHRFFAVLDAVTSGLAFIPFVGTLSQLGAEILRIAYDFVFEGVSLGSAARRGLRAYGMAAVGFVGDFASAASGGAVGVARAARSARRAAAAARAARGAAALDTANDVRAASRLSESAEAITDLTALERIAALAEAAPGALALQLGGGAADRIAAARGAGFTADLYTLAIRRIIDSAPALAKVFADQRWRVARPPRPLAQRYVGSQYTWNFRPVDACGPTAIAMILTDYGVQIRPWLMKSLSWAAGHGERGTIGLGLAAALRAVGFRTATVVHEIDQIRSARGIFNSVQRGHHVIAQVHVPGGGKHWIVVDAFLPALGQRPAGFVIRDPVGRRYTATAHQLAARLSGPVVLPHGL